MSKGVCDDCSVVASKKSFQANLRASTFLARSAAAAMLASAMLVSTTSGIAAQGAEGATSGDGLRAAPISVTATRNPMEAFSVPGQVTVKGAEDIADESPASLDDLFDDIPA